MKYYSLNGKAKEAGFKEAVIKGLAEDKGLYFPKEIPVLPNAFFQELDQLSVPEIAYRLIKPYIDDEIPEPVLKNIISETLSFSFPLVTLEENIATLELFHGPTMAFKDVGARFMARCLGYFNRDSSREVTVLVATSGDTGGAVASGFLGVENVKVVILYPSKKVSEVQEKQLTTLGKNISALEVEGTFDDCQAMVKQAFLDTEITEKKQLT
ncbi:MAG: pyridoxal-phosphate dependent enzyme, partial [Flavobacteriaceae bacterium]|nr:pyridoxal-phosphate dependent enzyme [Flavobacteriaceae bacterium]